MPESSTQVGSFIGKGWGRLVLTNQIYANQVEGGDLLAGSSYTA